MLDNTGHRHTRLSVPILPKAAKESNRVPRSVFQLHGAEDFSNYHLPHNTTHSNRNTASQYYSLTNSGCVVLEVFEDMKP